MSKFQISAIQMASSPNLNSNLSIVNDLMDAAIKKNAKLVVLPENFALMPHKDNDYLTIAEHLGHGPIQDFLSTYAKKNKIWLVSGTIPIKSNSSKKVYAATIVYDKSGHQLAHYYKMHLFDVNIPENNTESYRESDTFLPGNDISFFDTDYCRVGLAICYDIRFPELFRNLSKHNVMLTCIPSAFTNITGKAHWHSLIKARAIENLQYIVASCQGGFHVNGRSTYGHSAIVDPWGKIMIEKKSGSGIISSEIDIEYLETIRGQFPCLDHRKIT